MNQKIITLLLCCLLLSGMNITAFAGTGGSQTITANVPCTVTLQIGDHGSVTVDGTKYTGKASFQRETGAVVTYIITPDSGYKILKVIYDGADVTSAIKNGRYTAPPLKDNVAVTVSFVKQTSPGSPTSPGNLPKDDKTVTVNTVNQTGSGIPRTGDNSRIELWAALMCLSGAAPMIMVIISRKRRKES